MSSKTKRNSNYLVLLVDRKHARMFTLFNGIVNQHEEVENGQVPQKVKHGDNAWDAQDKIFRHIEDHLHRHLSHVAQRVAVFAKKNRINGIYIGGHKELFPKITKLIPYPFDKKIKGTFVTELKAPFEEILNKTKECIENVEEGREVARYEKYLSQH